MLPVLLILVMLSGHQTMAQGNVEARKIYFRMMTSIEQVKTCSFTINIEERIYDKYLRGKHRVKLQVKPLKLYLFSYKPSTGAEVLYKEGYNNGKALINPNRFPFINLNLHPSSSLLRKNHQYTLAQTGFIYLYNILRKYEAREMEKFYEKLHILKSQESESCNCTILEIRNNEFGYMNYKVMKGETVTTIAEKFSVNDYMILDLNRSIDSYDDVRTGQVITLPSSFAKRIVFYVDHKTGLPLKQFIYDNKGLYSKIEFTNFVVNPVFRDEEFTEDFPDYKF